jgi:hypothetical protein
MAIKGKHFKWQIKFFKKKKKKKEKKRSKFELEGTHDARSRQATQPPSELEKRFGVV